MIRVGIIGCGKIAQVRHIPEYFANDNCVIAGYFDLNKERSSDLAAKFGGKVYDSAEELVLDKDIDAVSVCTSNDTHAQITIAALNAGKNVLCEKPMATNLEDCETMVSAAKENSVFLMIGMNQRLTKAHLKAKHILENGVIGKVISFKTTFGHSGPETWSVDTGLNNWFFDKDRAAMGAMADLGVHKTDLIQFLLGSNVIETTAVISTLDKKYSNGEFIGVDDNAICIYKLENGVIGTMTASWSYYGEEDNSTVIYGTEGVMKIYDNPRYALSVFTKNNERILFDIEKIQTNDNQTKSGIIDEFVDSTVNKTEPSVNGESVLSAMRAVFASIESSNLGRTITIEENRGVIG